MQHNGNRENVQASKVDETKQPPQLSVQLAARRKFNTYFLTFWHLTHIASCSGESDLAVSWGAISATGIEWQGKLTGSVFSEFDQLLTASLDFINDKLRRLRNGKFSEASVTIIENYDKCLAAVEELEDLGINDAVDAIGVCSKLVGGCLLGVENFKQLPLSWNYLFVTRIHQLILLAKDCYFSDVQRTNFNRFDLLFAAHDSFATNLRQHFTTPTSTNSLDTASAAGTTCAVDPKLFQPADLLDTLAIEFDENAKCAAEQIPIALTLIIHGYCHIDPFNPDDMDAVKTKIIQICR